MWKVLPIAALAVVTLAGCGEERGYCAGVVPEVGADVQDTGFNNPDLEGVDICYADAVGSAFCSDLGGTFGSVDDYEDGGEEFCADQGYTYECRNSAFTLSEADCPAEE